MSKNEQGTSNYDQTRSSNAMLEDWEHREDRFVGRKTRVFNRWPK